VKARIIQGSEKRQFVRVPGAVPVTYRFVSLRDETNAPEDTFEGETRNLSAGGMLLEGPVPDSNLITDLLMKRVVLTVNLTLPATPGPVSAMARVSWLDSVDETEKRFSMGLEFNEITRESQDRIIGFIIRTVMP
jgi:c-di-GMP-binding flagellar brake protein YcgR